MKIEVGQVFILTEGEYTNFGMIGVFMCHTEFEAAAGVSYEQIEEHAHAVNYAPAPNDAELWMKNGRVKEAVSYD